MIVGDPNGFLGLADVWVIVTATVFAFLLGWALVAAMSRRLLDDVSVGLITYLVLVGVGLMITLVVGPFFLAADGPTYDRQAMGIAGVLNGTATDVTITSGKEGWPALLGGVYYLIGRVPFVGIIINCAATAIAAIFVAKTAQIIWGGFSTRRVLLGFLVSPLVLFLGPSLMREALCWMGVAMVICALAMIRASARHGLLLFVAGETVLFFIRSTLSVLILVGVGIAALFIFCLLRKHYLTLVFLTIGVVLSGVYLLEPLLASLGQTEEFIRANRQYISEDATTGFPSSELGSGPIGFLRAALEIAPRLFVGPYPWEIELSFVWGWVVLNTVVWIAALVLVCRRAVSLPRRSDSAVLLLGAALVLFGMALSLTNYGIVIRMRGIPYIMLLPLFVAQVSSARDLLIPTTKRGARSAIHRGVLSA